MARYVCGNEERRTLVEKSSSLNGIDFLEVVDVRDPAHPEWSPLCQLFLAVHLLRPVPISLTAANVRLDGGVRVTSVRSLWALPLAAVAGKADIREVERQFLAANL